MLWIIIAALLTFSLITSCNETFEPIKENDTYFFSIYGYLDASADTQWVRVTPLHDSIFPGTEASDSLDAIVSLVHLDSGEKVILNDSLFIYAQIAYAYNFWTTMDLQPDQTYKLIAERSDGARSTVTVSLPEEFPTPEIRLPPDRFDEDDPDLFSPDTLVMRGIDRLADVQAIYHVRNKITGDELESFIPHLKDTTRSNLNANERRVLIQPREDLNQVEEEARSKIPVRSDTFNVENYELFNCQMFIASAPSDYPKFHILSDLVITLPEGISNIENGVGYLAGIVSKTIPYPSHPWPEEPGLNPAPCPENP